MGRSSTDPLCHLCVLSRLRAGGPVPPETSSKAKIAVVGDAPGDEEVAEGRPFIGRSGQLLTAALKRVGVARGEVHWTNTLACMPRDNNLERALGIWRTENKKRKTAKRAQLPHPIECCKPRLDNELGRFNHVLAVGSVATKTVLRTAKSVMDMRGARHESVHESVHDGERFRREQKVGVTLHPSFVLRARRWMGVFHEDIARTLKWWRGIESWEPPAQLYRPTPDELRVFLAEHGDGAAFDTETDGIEPLTARLRCIGIGTAEIVCLVPFLGIDGRSTWYSLADLAEIKGILADWLVDPTMLKVGHNSGSYDRIICEQHLGASPTPMVDTILLHRSAESELPHNLGFVASTWAPPAPAWKADRTAKTAETDAELHEYCTVDVAQTHRIVEPLVAAVKEKKQERCFKVDTKMQWACADMHRAGLLVDQPARVAMERVRRAEAGVWRKRALDSCGLSKHNPSSFHQVRDLLYERWRLPIPDDAKGRPKVTKGGAPSTDDEAIRALRLHPATPKHAIAYLDAIRQYRKRTKELGTYIVKLAPMSEELPDEPDLIDDESPLQEAAIMALGGDADSVDSYEVAEWCKSEMIKLRNRPRGIVHADGRVHPSYNVHVATTGRLASSGPNAQNFPDKTRRIIVPPPGWSFIGADKEQLELRGAAARWGITKYIESMARGADSHSITALLSYGEDYRLAPGWPEGRWDGDYFLPVPGAKWKGLAKLMRDVAKKIQFGGQYWAEVFTIWRIVVATEDAEGNLIYATISKDEIAEKYDRWLAGAPELPAGWESEMSFFRKHGYIEEPILGRRRYFMDGENRNEIVNFPIQALGASLMALAMLDLLDRIKGLVELGVCRLVNQCHDSLMLEARNDYVAIVKDHLTAAMTQVHPAFPNIAFPGAAKIGKNWQEV